MFALAVPVGRGGNEPFYVSPVAFSFLQYGIPKMKQLLF